VLFSKHTEHALSGALVRGSHLAALFIDLDRFKPVNDAHGHAIGDAVLAAVAQRLTESVRTGDVVNRFGGDEFVVLCADLSDEQQGLEVAQRIQQALVLPHSYGTVEVSVGCSIGRLRAARHRRTPPPRNALAETAV
jgi:diguanylate cyclase (GGDEF)-like protein